MERAQLEETAFRTLFLRHPDPITLLGPDGRYLLVNDAARTLLGERAADIAGKSFAEVIEPHNVLAVRLAFEELLRGRESTYRLRVRRHDGVAATIEGRGVPVVVDGRTIAAFGINRDLTSSADDGRNTERLRMLAGALATGTPARERVDALLELARSEFGYDWAYFARLRDGSMTVENSVGASTRYPLGHSLELSPMMGRLVVEGTGLTVVEDFRAAAWVDDSSGLGRIWRAWAGVPMFVSGVLHGLLGCVSSTRPVPLAPSDRDFLIVLAAAARP